MRDGGGDCAGVLTGAELKPAAIAALKAFIAVVRLEAGEISPSLGGLA